MVPHSVMMGQVELKASASESKDDDAKLGEESATVSCA